MKTRWLSCSKKGRATRSGQRLCRLPKWFAAEDGLITVCTLIDFLREHPLALGNETQEVLKEIEEFERVLRKTAQHHLRWQLAVSWR